MAEVTTTFNPPTSAGTAQTYVVPAGITSVVIECWGAQGGKTSFDDGPGGRGGYAKGRLAVTPGETLRVYVGTSNKEQGRASDVRKGGTALSNRAIVAGGGGGGGYNGGQGGAGGGLVGGDGTSNPATSSSLGGGGGTASAGGTGAPSAGGSGASSGSLGSGGSGSLPSITGSGGDGYYGGGGGGWVDAADGGTSYGGGGGGGSSYIGGVTEAETTAGVRTGDGLVTITTTNAPPNAPSLTSMASGGNINRAATNRGSWVFSDPNPGDSQSAADVRYRQTGAESWTTLHSPVPTQSYDFTGGTFAAADYEWQARTYDAQGEVGPYSTSGFFTAVDAPAGPTITEPANDASVDATQRVTWSTAQQDAYRLRKVADSGGAAVTGTVYYDTGVVEEPTTRDLLVEFPINNRAEHVQVQVRYQGVWSPWSDVLVDVSYTPPPTPLVTLSTDPATGSLLVGITNPAPVSSDPAAVYNDVYVNDGDGEERRATGVPPNGSYRYWTPISGRDYSANIRVVAVAANGTTASS